MYKPLPKELRLGFSDIHDIGIFAKEGIAQGTNLGMTHINVGNNIIRTPLGGFLNHSEDANCVKAELKMFNEDSPSQPLNYKKWNLITLRNIKEGEELTLKYTFYTVKKDFLEEAEKEKKELEESYQESIRQTKERTNFYPKAIDGYSE
jgi:hypothetical protein